MKKLGIIVGVLAAVLLVAPFGIGKVAEKRLNADLDKFMEQFPYFKVAERTWSGGWFKSTQTVTFELSDTVAKLMDQGTAVEADANEDAEAADAEGTALPGAEDTAPGAAVAAAAAANAVADAAADEAATAEEDPADIAATAKGFKSLVPTRFTVRNNVLHGPILGTAGIGLARVDTHLDLSEKVRKEIEEVFGAEKPAFEVSTRVGFFGGGTTTFKSEGRKLQIKDKDVNFTYDDFKMSVGFSRNADTYDIDGRLPSMEIQDPSDGTHVTMTSLTVDGDGKRVMGDLYDGDFAIKVKELKVKNKAGNGDIVIADAHYIVTQNTKDDFVSFAAQMGTGAIQSDDFKKLNLEVKAIHYDFSMRHLHAPTLEKITSGMKNAYTLSLTDPAGFQKAVFEPLTENAAELLKHDPEFGIDRLGLVAPEGEIIAKGVIKLVGATVDDFTAANGMGLIGKLDADFTIEATQKLLEKFPNGSTIAGGAVDSGYAKREGDKLVCHVTFKAGELLINGKPQAIPGFGGPPPGAMEGQGMEGMEGMEDTPEE